MHNGYQESGMGQAQIPWEDFLQRNGINNPSNLNLVAEHINPSGLYSVLIHLENARILTQKNFEALMQQEHIAVINSQTMQQLFSHPEFAEVFNQEALEQLLHRSRQLYIITAFELNKARILRPENLATVTTHQYSDEIRNALRFLNTAEILTQENLDLLAQSTNVFHIAHILRDLNYADILTQENFERLLAHTNVEPLFGILTTLEKTDILTQANFEFILSFENIGAMSALFWNLQIAGILNQENLDFLCVAFQNIPLMNIEEINRILGDIPPAHLTSQNFRRLIIAAQQPNPRVRLIALRDQILAQIPGEIPAQEVINPRQSTHTASVHQSVSASAIRLLQSYGGALRLDETIEELKAFVEVLDDESAENRVAKRCIERITSIEHVFTDSSDVSTRQLLALAWIAIHDDSKRHGTLDDAKALLVTGLVEIQRGYNIEAGQGLEEGEDSPICMAGTFNKIMEKLNGIHSDVSVKYITHEGARLKFPKLVQSHVIAYLKEKQHLINVSEYLEITELLKDLQTDESLEQIWPKIKARVLEELFEEFKEAYGNNPNHPLFQELISCGEYVELPHLSDIKLEVEITSDVKAYLDEKVSGCLTKKGLLQRLHEHSLWGHRNASPAVRHAFDSQYGVIPTV